MPPSVALKPTQSLQLPSKLNRCYLGVGWQSRPGGREVDLDASAALFSGGQKIDLISFQKLRDTPAPPSSIVHTGDILAGDGSGGGKMKSSPNAARDLERIYFDLFKVNPQVDTIVLIINCYTAGASFAELQRATCRIVNADSEQEFGRFELGGGLKGNGLIMGQLCRTAPGSTTWHYVALGMARPGNTAEDLLRTLQQGARPAAPAKGNQVAPAPTDTVAKKPTASKVSPGMVAATAAGALAGAAIFTAVALDTGMLGGEGGGIMAGAMADLGDISMPDVPSPDIDFAPVGEAMADLGEMGGEAMDGAGRAIGDLGASLGEGFEQMGGAMGGAMDGMGQGMGEFAGNASEWAGGAGESMGEFAGNASEWAGGAAGTVSAGAGELAGNASEWAGGAGESMGEFAGNAGAWAGGAAGAVSAGAGEAAEEGADMCGEICAIFGGSDE